MVTIASFLVFILLTSLVIVIDITTYHYSFIKAWGILFQTDLLTGRIILYVHVPSALYQPLLSILEYVKKKRKKQTI